MTGFHSFDAAILFSGLVLTSVWVHGFLIIIFIIIHVHIHVQNAYCLYHYNTIIFNHMNKNKQGQKLLKKESDIGMLLIGKQSTETSCM